MRMVLCAGTAVAYSCVDFKGHVPTEQLFSHGVVHSAFARIAGQKGIMVYVKVSRA